MQYNATSRKAAVPSSRMPENMPGMDAETWQGLSREQREEVLEMYGFDGEPDGEEERRRRLSRKYSEVLIQQYRAEVTTSQFVEAGQVRNDDSQGARWTCRSIHMLRPLESTKAPQPRCKSDEGLWAMMPQRARITLEQLMTHH